ncbi:MAG: hypothetical protein M2R45_04982 [Verrucomicrobia subdivision 3 bacterium]|nr:hypothetical protein [Limisphaerales bacterium]MCS1415579.1 hypothetical protein [Limisphaerales bacterium]
MAGRLGKHGDCPMAVPTSPPLCLPSGKPPSAFASGLAVVAGAEGPRLWPFGQRFDQAVANPA